ncbi:RRN7 [Candida jiufengensis]|uniref:RRN7 n=1 Tax=Candida jiufengensis TaxID=497108 RepID=UPI0022250155|nr:RRN7 [Candida jiufengensis]KAI5951555.1 RRN7 [Candida jiufengensis]
MAKHSWFKGPVCGTDNCKSRLYRSQDGLTICQYGHVLEGAIEFNDDQETVSVQTRRLNVVAVDERGNFESQSSQRVASKIVKEKLVGNEAMPIYFKCLQILLKHQLNSIIKIYFSDGVKNELTLIVKTNWCKVLNYYYEQYDDIRNKSNNEKKSIDIFDLICIIYISSLQLRSYPLYISDLMECLSEDKIPYFKTFHLLPSDELNQLHGTYYERLQAHSKPTSGLIYRRIFHLNSKILENDLKIPTTYYFSYIYNTFSSLLLPNTPDLFMMIFKFLKLFGKSDFEIPSQIKTEKKLTEIFPEVYLTSMMIYIIKLYFEYGEYDYLNNWLEYVKKYDTEYEYNNNLNDEILLNWSQEKTERYCDWIYNHIMPQKYRRNDNKNEDDDEEEEELSIMEKRLFQIFTIDDKIKTNNNNDSNDDNDLINDNTNELMTTKYNTLKQIIEYKDQLKNQKSNLKGPNINIKELEIFLFNKLSKNLNLNIESFEKYYTTIKKQFNNIEKDKLN